MKREKGNKKMDSKGKMERKSKAKVKWGSKRQNDGKEKEKEPSWKGFRTFCSSFGLSLKLFFHLECFQRHVRNKNSYHRL